MFRKVPGTDFYKYQSSGSHDDSRGPTGSQAKKRTDGRTDMTQLIGGVCGRA
jgi:hypothetical protein